MEIPKFSDWQRFDTFKENEIAKFPSVYILAHFDKPPIGITVTTSPNIIYVGETTKQTLGKRLLELSRSAFERKNGHSGGWATLEKY